MIDRTLVALFGDARHCSLEHRLFNTVTLLSAVANLAGGAFQFATTSGLFLPLLHIGTGLLFLGFYYASRTRDAYRALYWPFVLLIIAFLFVNSIRNAGSTGGAHYYLVPALVIAIILSARARTTVAAILLFAAVTVSLLLLEYARPEWITSYASREGRLFDIIGSLVFAQLFTAVLVVVLTRNLNQERRKSDLLLLNVLPESIARELKTNDRVQPLSHDDASVLFTDFVGFTQIAEQLTPEELVRELDLWFRAFDGIAKRHNLEKIKTIGDSYMAVGGVPVPNRTHAIDCVLAALEMQRFIAGLQEEREGEGRPCWHVRIGIHSGRLVAGVIGQEKFAYDVWGDTVNTASRLESAGEPNRVNISGETYRRVERFFVCSHRGLIPTKHKGDVDMYFVDQIRPELSKDARGQAPNESFLAMYARTEPTTGDHLSSSP